MRKRRCLWAAALLLTALLYFFENNAGTLTLLLSVLFLPLPGLLPLLCPVSAALSASAAAEKGQGVNGAVRLTNGGVLPLPRVALRLSCRNLRTGEETAQTVAMSLLPKETREAKFRLDCPHCGTIRMEVTEVTVYDLFGLARRQKSCPADTEFTVLPTLFQTELVLRDSAAALPDSDVYAADRPGNDPGETFAVREYVPGDALRKIHWKLSEKTDRVMVREFGLPVVNEVLLLLETAGSAGAGVTDAITEVFASVSRALLTQGCTHQVGWQGAEGVSLQTVSTEPEFDTMLEALLRLPPRESGSVARSFSEVAPHGGFAHVLVVAPQLPAGMRELVSGNRVSVLLCGQAASEGLQPDGTYLLSFDSAGYAQTLCRLEV